MDENTFGLHDGRKVVVTRWIKRPYPTAPDLWRAVFADAVSGGDPVGWGRDQDEALTDLMQREHDRTLDDDSMHVIYDEAQLLGADRAHP